MPEQSVQLVSMGGGGGGGICGPVLPVFAGVAFGCGDPMGLVEKDCGRLAERMGWVPLPPALMASVGLVLRPQPLAADTA